MNLTRLDIRVTDRSGNQKALLTSTAGMWPIIDAEFDLLKNGGCNSLTFRVKADQMRGTISLGYLVAVKAQPVGGALTTYWYGAITKVPNAASTSEVFTYEAKGLWFAEVEKVRPVKYYDSQPIDDVVTDLLADFDTPATAVSSSAGQIIVASPYTVADIEVEFDTVSEVIDQLATMQADVQYGVDPNGTFYFKDISTAVVKTYVVGTHLSSFNVEDSTDAVVNDIYVQSKQVIAGGQTTIHDSDSTSKTAYGTRSKVIQLRNTKSMADATQYLASVKATLKDPATKVEADIPPFSDYVFPRGKVRIIKSGVEYTFPIQRVRYTVNGETGMTGAMELGSDPAPKLDEQVKRLVTQIERSNSNAVSLTKIDHTRGEEFAQQILVEARKAGYLNTYIAFLSDDNCIDKTMSIFGGQAFYNGQIVGPFGLSSNRLFSIAIPTASVPSSVMLHTYTDERGRITFDDENDFDQFFENANWRLDETGTGRAEQYNTSATLYYRKPSLGSTKGTPFKLPANHSFRFRFRISAINTGRPMKAAWGKVTGSTAENYLEIEMTTGTNLRVIAKKVDAFSVTTTMATINETVTGVGDERIILVTYGTISGQYTVRIMDIDEVTVKQTSASFTVSVPLDSRIYFDNWYNATDSQAGHLTWFEPQYDYIGNNTVYVSRNDWSGSTTSTILNGGKEHSILSLTSTTSGQVLRVLFVNAHPGRILGWGISW